MSDRLELIKRIADKKGVLAWYETSLEKGLEVFGSDPIRKIPSLEAEITELEKQLREQYPIPTPIESKE